MQMFLLLALLLGSVLADVDRPMGSSSLGHYTEGLRSRRGELVAPPEVFDLEGVNRVFFSDFKQHTHELQRAKYYLVNGELRLAAVFLEKLVYVNTKLKPVILRYLVMLNFIDGDYRKALNYMKGRELNSPPHFAKICTLRTITQIILGFTDHLEDVWSRCQVEAYGKINPSNLPWLETLIKLRVRPTPGVTSEPFTGVKLEALSVPDLKIFLKLAIYLNQEDKLISEIPALSVDQLQDTEVRELVGHIFFRTGQFANSFKYVEDLKSPNSENIKGNLYVLRSKYELAYAQFKLALEQKQNSQNAMERLLPLAWLLGDWAGGASYAESVIASPQTFINKMTLAAAFNIQKGSFEEARKILDKITQRSRRGGELDVTQLYSFAALMQNFSPEAKKYADLSCAQYDLTNCWLLFQLVQWDAFPVMIRRDEKITHKRDWEKLLKEDINDPLKEPAYVNQVDIEELDDKLIKLIPEEKTPASPRTQQ